jgi:hypothetical protein
MRPVGKVGCNEKKVMTDVHTRKDMSLKSKPEQKKKMERKRWREKDGEKKMERERWRKSQVLRTEATVVRGGLRDQD